MALNGNALITWEQFKLALDIKEEDEKDLYEWLINGASNRVEQMVGRSFLSQERTEYYSGHGDDAVILNVYPVTEIGSLYLDSSRDFGAATEIAAADYDLDDRTGIVYLLEDLTASGRKTVKVTYTGGYETIPEDIQAAVVEIVVSNYRRMMKNQTGIKSISGPDSVGTTYELSIPINALQVIDLYREVRV